MNINIHRQYQIYAYECASLWTFQRDIEVERDREKPTSHFFFAYANRHIIIDKEEKRVAYDANWYGQTTYTLYQAETSVVY